MKEMQIPKQKMQDVLKKMINIYFFAPQKSNSMALKFKFLNSL